MSNKITTEDLSLINSGLDAISVQVAQRASAEHGHEICCDFINNKNGTLRWIWPSCSKRASFLKFYHQGSLQSKITAQLISLCYMFGLGRFIISGTARLYINNAGQDILEGFKDWALFTGTIGENRKLVAWFEANGASYFAKIPLTSKAAKIVENEAAALCKNVPSNVLRPEAQAVASVLVQSDLYANQCVEAPSSISDLPVQLLIDWAKNGLVQSEAQHMHGWDQMKLASDCLGSNTNKFSPILLKRLKQLTDSIGGNDVVSLANAHGDFTPWNMKFNSTGLFLIDWELYAENRPALYDVFHFVYQDSILVKRSSFTDIRLEIDRYFASNEWREYLNENEIDVRLCEKLYLISVVNYYLDVYSRQDVWHMQVDWLLQIWHEAMGYWLSEGEILQPRQTVLQDITHFLRNQPYAVLKLGDHDLSELPETSDVDLCIHKKDAVNLLAYLRKHVLVNYLHTNAQSFMNQTTIVLNNGSLIHLDCIWSIRRRNIVFLSIAQLLSTSRVNPFGISVPSVVNDVKYVWLFHLLNNALTPERYISSFKTDALGSLAIYELANEFKIRPRFFWEPDSAEKSDILKMIKSQSGNKGLSRVANSLKYFFDKMLALKVKKGHVITFSGVDGAGKSTVIDIISKKIEKELRQPVVVLRHRPSILPILSAWKYGKQGAEARSVSRLPRTGTNKAGVSSYLRFGYYYLDYLLGQFYIQIRYVQRGYVVLYDRYYFDFINDSKRSNIVIPESFASSLYRLLIKPEFNYFLYAPAEIILARKQELDTESIETLTKKYLTLFSDLQLADKANTYKAISNIHLDSTLNIIFSNLKKSILCSHS